MQLDVMVINTNFTQASFFTPLCRDWLVKTLENICHCNVHIAFCKFDMQIKL